MVNELMCKLIYDQDKDKDGERYPFHFESASIGAAQLSLEDQIEEDKRYGKMVPRNGKYFTVRAMDWSNKWIESRQIKRGVVLAFHQAEIEIPIDVRYADFDEEPDFKVYFRATEDDPNLTRNTVMYHYYPINDINNPLRGVCVVNTDFDFTIDGENVSMFEVDPDHYTEDTKVVAPTIDFDEVYTHEGDGHGLGLPHSTYDWKVMSPTVGKMAKWLASEEPLETIPRLIAKYGKRSMLSKHRLRWRNWYKIRSEKY